MHKVMLNSHHLQENFLPLTYLKPFKEILFGTQSIGQRLDCTESPSNFTFSTPWDLIRQNAQAICSDEQEFRRHEYFLTNAERFNCLGSHNLLVHKSARIEDCYFNTTDGPIIIDENAHLMGGSTFRGPIYIGKASTIKMGATIYGGTSIGKACVIGGEVKNSIFQEFTNKGHHGYIGDSFIGSWCNLGAGTSCSNVKNTGGSIKYWNISANEFQPGGNKCGILMGDFCKTAINTSLNSGTVVGIFSNIFDAQLLSPKYIPAFSWGCHTGKSYDPDKIHSELNNWMAMKNHQPSKQELATILALYNQIKKA